MSLLKRSAFFVLFIAVGSAYSEPVPDVPISETVSNIVSYQRHNPPGREKLGVRRERFQNLLELEDELHAWLEVADPTKEGHQLLPLLNNPSSETNQQRDVAQILIRAFAQNPGWSKSRISIPFLYWILENENSAASDGPLYDQLVNKLLKNPEWTTHFAIETFLKSSNPKLKAHQNDFILEWAREAPRLGIKNPAVDEVIKQRFSKQDSLYRSNTLAGYLIRQGDFNEGALKQLRANISDQASSPIYHLGTWLEKTAEKPSLTPQEKSWFNTVKNDLEKIASGSDAHNAMNAKRHLNGVVYLDNPAQVVEANCFSIFGWKLFQW
jgi:hypothetical protein